MVTYFIIQRCDFVIIRYPPSYRIAENIAAIGARPVYYLLIFLGRELLSQKGATVFQFCTSNSFLSPSKESAIWCSWKSLNNIELVLLTEQCCLRPQKCSVLLYVLGEIVRYRFHVFFRQSLVVVQTNFPQSLFLPTAANVSRHRLISGNVRRKNSEKQIKIKWNLSYLHLQRTSSFAMGSNIAQTFLVRFWRNCKLFLQFHKILVRPFEFPLEHLWFDMTDE